MRNRATLYLCKQRKETQMAQYKSYTHVLRIDKDEVQGILCGDVVVMPKLDGTNTSLFVEDCVIYAAYLFEKEYCGDDLPIEEYYAKELAFASLTDGERAEVEDAIVDQLGELKVARKKVVDYLNAQTLAAKLTSVEVIVRPDLEICNAESIGDTPA